MKAKFNKAHPLVMTKLYPLLAAPSNAFHALIENKGYLRGIAFHSCTGHNERQIESSSLLFIMPIMPRERVM